MGSRGLKFELGQQKNKTGSVRDDCDQGEGSGFK